MYNIDFRVSGQIISIPVSFNDTIPKLITRMKEISSFGKYSNYELEDRLVKCLNQIVQKEVTQSKIKGMIKGLLDKISQRSPHKQIQINSQASNKRSSNNNTFVNMLQQQSLNASYLAHNDRSQPKLNRNYGGRDVSNFDNCDDHMQSQLKYKYTGGNLQTNYQREVKVPINKSRQVHCIDTRQQNKVNINSYLNRRKSSINNVKNQPSFQRSTRGDISEVRGNNTRNYLEEIREVLKPKSKQKPISRNRTIDPKISNTNTRGIPSQNKPINCENYNPVPRLNQLIQRSKSLSQVPTTNYNYQNKVPQKTDAVSYTQNNSNAGKIQHRKSVNNTSYQRKGSSQNNIPSRSNSTNYRQTQTKSITESLRQRQINTILNQSSLNFGKKNQNQPTNQNKKNHYQTKRVYSYL